MAVKNEEDGTLVARVLRLDYPRDRIECAANGVLVNARMVIPQRIGNDDATTEHKGVLPLIVHL
jgi:hypothetical protein